MHPDWRDGIEEIGIAHDVGRRGKSDPNEVDDDVAGLALAIVNRDRFAVAPLQLLEQGQRIMVVDKSHRLPRGQHIDGSEDSRMAEPLGDSARIERIDALGRYMRVNGLVHGWFLPDRGMTE